MFWVLERTSHETVHLSIQNICSLILGPSYSNGEPLSPEQACLSIQSGQRKSKQSQSEVG